MLLRPRQTPSRIREAGCLNWIVTKHMVRRIAQAERRSIASRTEGLGASSGPQCVYPWQLLGVIERG
jgi:hypothetical protein